MNPRSTRIGKFEVGQSLGEGAMGAVFLARDTIIGREVALKAIHPSAVAAPEARERFFRQAQAAARLNHPNLVTIHEFGEDNGTLFMAMEYVAGADLAQVLRERTLPPREMLELLAQVCDGLAYAHARGVAHRDIKPSNIRVTRVSGRPSAKILELGTARLTGSDLGATGSLTGTFAYMAPEHTQSGKLPDAKADIFAVGAILYEALAGCRPFDGENASVILHRLLNEDPAPLDLEQLTDISPAIQGVMSKALAKDPLRRYPSAAALATALRAARNPNWSPQADAEQLERVAHSMRIPGLTPKPEPAEAGPKSRLWLWAVALVAVLALAGGAGFALRHHRRRPAPQPVAVALPAPPPAPVTPPPPPVAEPPAVEPAPEPVKAPVSRSRFKTLDEAAAALPTSPQAALVHFEETLEADPGNERALGLRIAALYQLGNYGPCARAMKDAKASGHTILALSLACPQLRKVLEAERNDPKLPRKPKAPEPAPAP